MLKKTTLICAFIISCMTVEAQTDTSETEDYDFTLEECLNFALNHSYSRQVNLLNEESLEATYEQSKNNRLPSVNASASENMSHSGKNKDVNFSGNAGINASQTIYQGGSIKNTIEKNRLELEQGKIRTSQADDNLTIQILNEYLTALSCMERLKYQQSIVNASRIELSRAEVRYNAGALIESDYLMHKAQLQSDLADSLNTVISLENSILNLKRYMSMNPEANLTIKEPDTSAVEVMALLPERGEVLDRAKDHMPDMRLALSSIETANTALEISKAGSRPSISASAGISTGHNDFDNLGQQFSDRFSQQIGISLSYPVWDRGANRLQVKKAKIQQQQAELDYRQAELDVTRTVSNQYRATELEYQRYLAYKERKDAYAASFDAYQKKYDAGAILTTDLLQQQNNYINALNNYINAKYGFILNRKILDVYTGESVDL